RIHALGSRCPANVNAAQHTANHRVGTLVTGRHPPRSSRTPGAPSSGRSARLGPEIQDGFQVQENAAGAWPAAFLYSGASSGSAPPATRRRRRREPAARVAVEEREAHRLRRDKGEVHEGPAGPT